MKIKLKEIIVLVLFIVVVSAIAIFIKNAIRDKNQEKEIEALINVEFKGEPGSGDTASGYKKEKKEEEITVTGNAIAVLQIPSQGIRGVVKEGTDNETIKNYIGMFKGSALPGQPGNFSVAAHNNIYTEIFRNLSKVNIGDEVKVTTRTATYTYKITSKQTVSPTSIEVINNDTSKREITLITCNYNASARVVLKGELI